VPHQFASQLPAFVTSIGDHRSDPWQKMSEPVQQVSAGELRTPGNVGRLFGWESAGSPARELV
jgi:hypothetical protein